MNEQAEAFGTGRTDSFIDEVEQIVDQRRAETEWKNEEAWKNGTVAFGARYLTPEMYLDYEWKSIQLALWCIKVIVLEIINARFIQRMRNGHFMRIIRICLPDIMEICFHMKKWI